MACDRSFPRSVSRSLSLVFGLLATAGIAAGCSGESAVPLDPNQPAPSSTLDLGDVSHSLEPNDVMKNAAEQQCRDNPDQEVGYVKAVDPESAAIVAEYSIPCDEVTP